MGKKGDNIRKGGHAHIVAETKEENIRELIQPNQDEIRKMILFIKKFDKPTDICYLTYSYLGTFENFPFDVGLSVSDRFYNKNWIPDSSATDHMTPLPKNFSSYTLPQ